MQSSMKCMDAGAIEVEGMAAKANQRPRSGGSCQSEALGGGRSV